LTPAYDWSVSDPYDVLFSMPWGAPLLAGSGATGGAETQILTVARWLAASGLSVGVVVIGERRELPSQIDGVAVLTLPRPPRRRGLAGLLHDFHTLRVLGGTPARVLVHRGGSRTVAVAALAARLQRAGFVYSSSSVSDFDLGRRDRPYNVWLFERGLRRAAEVVVQNREQAALCQAKFGREPVVIPSIAEPAELRSATPEAFLWIGRMAPYKRLDVYLDLAASVPEARFQVIAAPALEEQPEIAARLERAAVELPNLEVLSPRPRRELGQLIDRAVAVVSTGDFEGRPNVFLEGWSRGVPALVFSYDPDGVVSEHGLGAVAGGSPERLAEQAREQWATRMGQRDLAERCVEYVRSHHAPAVAGAAWREIVTRNGARR
jgi:glycosyltransferase involved in cell wall biosynthesis